MGAPSEKRPLTSQTVGFLERNVYSSARHAGDEERKYIQSGYQATQQSTLNQVAIHPDDSLPQAEAVSALPDHLAQSRALREQFRGQLGTPNARRMWFRPKCTERASFRSPNR
jgi:hypothetical protein